MEQAPQPSAASAITSRSVPAFDTHKTLISDLPDGVLCIVFRHLRRRDCAAVRLTCRHWQNVLDSCLDSLRCYLDRVCYSKMLGRFSKLQNLVVRNRHFWIGYPLIADLSGISVCCCLQTVVVEGAHLQDLRPLALCQQLHSLCLSNCPSVTDVQPLAACSYLTQLDLSSTPVADAGPLAACEQLKMLSLGSCRKLTSLGALVAHTSLKVLDILGQSHLGIEDLGDLSAWSQLQWLDLSDTPTSNLEALADCQSLTSLSLNRCPVLLQELISTSQEWCMALTSLSLSGVDVEGLWCIPLLCQRLVCLDLSDSAVSDIGFLSQCTAIQKLFLWATGVVDITPLSACHHLETLDISYTAVFDVAPLAMCTLLENLNLNQSSVTDISPLVACSKLRRLVYPQLILTCTEPPLGTAAVCCACPFLEESYSALFSKECDMLPHPFHQLRTALVERLSAS